MCNLRMLLVRTSTRLLLSGVLLFLVFFPSMSLSGDEVGIMKVELASDSEPLVKDVETGLDYLFEVLADKNAVFDSSKISHLLDFVVGMEIDPKNIEPAERFGGDGVCMRQEVATDLDKILRYFYNPDIPNFLLCPAVLRFSGWYEGSEFLTRQNGIWEELPGLSEPVLVRGREFEANTPDSFAESYYSYDLNRLIILLKHAGKNVAISISEQDGKSDVGRKGAILDDQQWNYFYSGIEGLNRDLISWMDTFMYKSGSVQIFVEHDATVPRSSAFLFKWLNAGWAGMNVVERSHIYDGILRYARSFVKVLESRELTPESVAESLGFVADLSEQEINTLIEKYAENFKLRFKDDPKLAQSEYAKVIKGGYHKVLGREARKSLLALEKLKSLIGMETLIDIETFRTVDRSLTAGEKVAIKSFSSGS